MRKLVIVHPFLFAVFPVLLLFALLAIKQDTVDALALPVVCALSLTLGLYALLSLVLKNLEKAALLTTIFWWFFYSVNLLFIADVEARFLGWGHVLPPLEASILLLWWGLLALAGFLTVIGKRSLTKTTSVLNDLGIFLVVLEVLIIASHEFQTVIAYKGRLNNIVAEGLDSVPRQVSQRPDIFYIVLDENTGPRTLLREFGYNNSDFIKGLEARGFYVPTDSHSNYPRTQLSLSSSLNMMYLDRVANLVGSNTSDSSLLSDLLREHRVGRILKRLGYRLVNVGSGFGATAWNPHADNNLECGPAREFPIMALQWSVLGLFPQTMRFCDQLWREQKLCMFTSLAKAADIPGPKFVFAHILLPHDPFLFNVDGTASPGLSPGRNKAWDAAAKGKYVEQLQFTEKRILAVVDQILSRSATKPIVIIQGDHGSMSSGSVMDAKPSDRFLQERMSILNAYYLPGNARGGFYDTITPVNTFRVLLHKYLSVELSPLADRMYYSPYARPFEFVDETDRVVGH